jgi:hypothetical protein
MNLIFQVRLNVAIRKVECVGGPAARIGQENARLDVEVDKGGILTCSNTTGEIKAFGSNSMQVIVCLLYLLTTDDRA